MLGRTAGTTNIHAICDAFGRAIAIEVILGQLGDMRAALALLGHCLPCSSALPILPAYGANGLRSFLIDRGATPVIPNNPTRSVSVPSTLTLTNGVISPNGCSVV